MKLDRRTLLAACGAAAAGAWWLRGRPSVQWDSRREDSGITSLDAFPEHDPETFQLFALGDIGWDSPEREQVVRRMAEVARTSSPDCIALLGDNFYREGVSSVDDPRWRTGFEECFPRSELDVPFVAALGNHDHNGNVDAQIEYSQRSSRWHMPGRWYSHERALGTGGERIAMFTVDTTPLRENWFGGSEQVDWLEEELRRCTATWRVVLGHHPMLSYGEHGGESNVVRAFAPLFAEHGVQFYLSGHDHDLQLLRSNAGWCQIVSGAGSSTRETARGPGSAFALAEPGFTRIRFDADAAHVQFVSATGGARGTFRVARTLARA